jgi:hypothetical protein
MGQLNSTRTQPHHGRRHGPAAVVARGRHGVRGGRLVSVSAVRAAARTRTASRSSSVGVSADAGGHAHVLLPHGVAVQLEYSLKAKGLKPVSLNWIGPRVGLKPCAFKLWVHWIQLYLYSPLPGSRCRPRKRTGGAWKLAPARRRTRSSSWCRRPKDRLLLLFLLRLLRLLLLLLLLLPLRRRRGCRTCALPSFPAPSSAGGSGSPSTPAAAGPCRSGARSGDSRGTQGPHRTPAARVGPTRYRGCFGSPEMGGKE